MKRLVQALCACLAAMLMPLCLAQTAPAALPVLRISSENSPAHFQTKVIQGFADTLARRTKGRLVVKFSHSAQLFRDQDVVRALSEGQVDMAVPGNWQLDRYDPYVSLLMLPMFMGRSADDHHRFRDGKLGQLISRHLAESLQVVIPGRWIDLGYAHVFTTKKEITGFEDLAGMRIRIAGGAAIAAQVMAVGAVPTVVPWTDLPDVLNQGRLDGLLSTYESIASAQLWDMGLAHAAENEAYFAQYIPLVSRSFWDAMPPDLQAAIRDSWESVVDQARADAQAAQLAARQTLEAHGVRMNAISPARLQAWRERAMRDQASLAKQLGIPAELVKQARAQISSSP